MEILLKIIDKLCLLSIGKSSFEYSSLIKLNKDSFFIIVFIELWNLLKLLIVCKFIFFISGTSLLFTVSSGTKFKNLSSKSSFPFSKFDEIIFIIFLKKGSLI